MTPASHRAALAGSPPTLAKKGRALIDGSGDPACELENLLHAAEKAGHEVRCYDDARAFLAELRDARRRRELFAQAYAQGAHAR